MNKEEQDKNNHNLLGDGLIVAICSALGYLLAFIREIGYASHFGIPQGFINLPPAGCPSRVKTA